MKARALGLTVAFLAGAATGGPAPEAVRGEKVLLENERVRVVEFVLEPAVPMGMHDHPRDRVEINVAGGRVKVTTADGRTEEADEKDGAVVFSKASGSRHDVVNIGKTTLRAYHVELK